MSQPILVTGGAGFIGSHTCKLLAAAGWLPVTYDNLSTGHRSHVKWGPLEVGDIADAARLDEVMARHRPVAVIHFAASAYVGEGNVNPAKYYANNVCGSLSLLNAMRRNEIDQIVFSSSCATYGMKQQPLIDEDHPQQPINTYGFTKLVVEHMLRDYQRAYGLRSIALRYFNAAGADPDGDLRENHDPETHLIPLVLAAGLGTRPPVTVLGRDYNTPDGTCIRDYVHVTDIARAHVAALPVLAGQSGMRVYNLATGRGYSVQDIIDRSGVVLGRKVPYIDAPRRLGDPDILVADGKRAFDELGWKPEFSDLDRILSTAAASMTSNALQAEFELA